MALSENKGDIIIYTTKSIGDATDYVLTSDTVECDAVKCTLIHGGSERIIYCANMVNIGFDCNAADMTSTMKKKPSYKKGIGDIVTSLKCKAIKYTSLSGSVRVCIDGEIYDADKTELEVIPKAFKFAGQRKSV